MSGSGRGTTRGEIRHRLINLISQIAEIPSEQVTEGAAVDRELRMESASFIEVQVAIEDQYDIEIDPLHMLNLNEFGAIVNYVYELVLQRSGRCSLKPR